MTAQDTSSHQAVIDGDAQHPHAETHRKERTMTTMDE